VTLNGKDSCLFRYIKMNLVIVPSLTVVCLVAKTN